MVGAWPGNSCLPSAITAQPAAVKIDWGQFDGCLLYAARRGKLSQVKITALTIAYTARMNILSRDHKATLATLLGWLLIFQVYACCFQHGQGSGALLNGVMPYCAVSGADPLLATADTVDLGNNLSAALGCPLCASGTSVVVASSGWRLAMAMPVAVVPEPSEFLFALPAAPPWRPLNPRAPPVLV